MKIAIKLLLGFTIVAIIAGIVGIVGVFNIRDMKNTDNKLFIVNVKGLDY